MNIIYDKTQSAFIFQFDFRNLEVSVKLLSVDYDTRQIKLSLISSERSFGKATNDLQDRVIEILGPGEYEYAGIYVTAMEIMNDDKQDYLGCINFLVFSFQDVYFVYVPFKVNLKNLSINLKDQNKIVLIVDNKYQSEWIAEILKFLKVSSILSSNIEIISTNDLSSQKSIIKSQKVKLNQLFGNTLQIIYLTSD